MIDLEDCTIHNYQEYEDGSFDISVEHQDVYYVCQGVVINEDTMGVTHAGMGTAYRDNSGILQYRERPTNQEEQTFALILAAFAKYE